MNFLQRVDISDLFQSIDITREYTSEIANFILQGKLKNLKGLLDVCICDDPDHTSIKIPIDERAEQNMNVSIKVFYMIQPVL